MRQGGRVRAVRSALLVLLSMAPAHLASQALLLPPLPHRESFEAEGFLPEIRPWTEFRHFPAAWGGAFHSHILDFGSAIRLFSAGPFSADGMVRQILLTRLHPDGEWLFWPAALYTDLRLGIGWGAAPWSFALGYRHDCKHDIETYYGRDAAHDAIAWTVALPRLRWAWAAMGPESRLAVEAEAALNIPLLFQYNPPEPDLFTLSAGIDWEPLRISGWPAPFLSGGLAWILRSGDTRVAIRESMALDWHVRLGLRLAGEGPRSGILAAYGQLESLSDDRMSLEPGPAVLLSCGLLTAF